MLLSSLLKSSLLVAGTVAPWLVAAGEGSDVIDLTQSNFESVIANEPLVLVEFFAPWCGHCKALAPHYDEAATSLKEKNIKLAKVDCVDQADLCQQHSIAGYPTLKVYKNGTATDYNGPRKADGIISYMIKQSLPAVTPVTAENHEEFIKADKVVVVAYVASTEDASPVFSDVAEALREEYLFGQTADEAAIQAAGVKPPAVVLYKTFDEGRVDFGSAEVASVTTESLTAFIKGNSVPLLDQISGENYAVYATSGLPLAYLFVDPEDPKKDEYINELMPIAKEHKGLLVLTEPKWPSFVIQDPQSQLKYPLDQSIAPTHQVVNQMMNDFVAGRLEPKLKTEPVPESQDEFAYYKVVGTTFEKVVLDDEKDVFVQFSAPWCGHCKRLAPTWDELATRYTDLKDKIVIAKMDATENDLPPSTPFQVSGFPTLKFKPAGSRDFIDYEGDRSLESLIEFVESKAKNDLSALKYAAPEDATEASAARPAATPVEAHDEL
ncbi:hypothetical protein BS47DRAFT_1377367 [Hydnum rufescens UP504]|uniref:Protein disulfide-isomerase n=1 Tax=Hydnum rufescens UP504 TaxID=1448309 RepID=A0A9P6DTR5_9AGAM|nr:hypothetical protein BS47DRAFT_1377367 [Hydnum rufescens UP504]